MAVSLLLVVLFSFYLAAKNEGTTPGTFLAAWLPVWALFLPVILLPRRVAIISGAVFACVFTLIGGILLVLVMAPPNGGSDSDGMWKIAAFFIALLTLVLALMQAGAALARWYFGRTKA